MTADKLLFRPMNADAKDLLLLRDFFSNNSDRARSLELLKWQYLQNTVGRLFVSMAINTETQGSPPVAIYATLPLHVCIYGERRLAAQSLDTMTDANFRSKGLFVALARSTFARVHASGGVFIYGFPNRNSAHGFFKKLGWINLDPVPFLIRPLRLKYFAKRLKLSVVAHMVPDMPLIYGHQHPPDGCKLVRLNAFDERVTRLWDEFAKQVGVAIERDAAYFTWRIANKPEENYQTLALEKDGELKALVTFCVKDKHGGRIGYIMELIYAKDAASKSAQLLAIALRELADQQADAVLAWNFTHSPNHSCFTKNGFFPLPERMRPIELHFGVRVFDCAVPRVYDRDQWYLSYLDSDTV